MGGEGGKIIHQFGTFGDGDTGMAASSGDTVAMHNPRWSRWKRVWKVLNKDSITGKQINGRINERRIKVWADGSWQHMVEYASDKELFEGALRESIPEYYV